MAFNEWSPGNHFDLSLEYLELRRKVAAMLEPGAVTPEALAEALLSICPETLEREEALHAARELIQGCEEGAQMLAQELDAAGENHDRKELLARKLDELARAAGADSERARHGFALNGVQVLYYAAFGRELDDDQMSSLSNLPLEELNDRLIQLADQLAEKRVDNFLRELPGTYDQLRDVEKDQGIDLDEEARGEEEKWSRSERALIGAAAQFALGVRSGDAGQAVVLARAFGVSAGMAVEGSERIREAREAGENGAQGEDSGWIENLKSILEIILIIAACVAIVMLLGSGYAFVAVKLVNLFMPIMSACGPLLWVLLFMVCLYWPAIPLLAWCLIDMGIEYAQGQTETPQLSDKVLFPEAEAARVDGSDEHETGDEGEDDSWVGADGPYVNA